MFDRSDILNVKASSRMFKIRSVIRGVISSTLSLLLAFDASPATFHGLGTLPSGNSSFAYAASADGSVVVGNSTYGGFGTAPFRWTEKTGMVTLTPSQTNSYGTAFGVSADGNIIVGTAVNNDANWFGAFVWRNETGIQPLPINDNGYANARGVSGDGSVIVGEWEPDQTAGGSVVPCVWWNTNGPFTFFDTEPSYLNEATTVSDNGTAIAGSSGTNAFFWTTNDGLFLITDQTGSLQYVNGWTMSRNAQFVGGAAYVSAAGQWGMFRWTKNAGIQILGWAPGDTSSEVLSISNDGNTAIGATEDDQNNTGTGIALIWRPEWGVRHLQDVLTNDYGLVLTGWHLVGARGVSVDGTVIVGNGINPSGNMEAFIATIEPALPHLAIQFDSVNCVLSWPTNAANFSLQQCSDGTITNWVAVSNTPVTVGDQFVVTNSVSSTPTYFRLKKL